MQSPLAPSAGLVLDKGGYQALFKELKVGRKKFGAGGHSGLGDLGYIFVADALGVQIDGFSGGESTMTILLQQAPGSGERTIKIRVRDTDRFHYWSFKGQRRRYQDSGQVDAATGFPIFVYAPRRGKV
jgi:hypothetical protein